MVSDSLLDLLISHCLRIYRNWSDTVGRILVDFHLVVQASQKAIVSLQVESYFVKELGARLLLVLNVARVLKLDHLNHVCNVLLLLVSFRQGGAEVL